APPVGEQAHPRGPAFDDQQRRGDRLAFGEQLGTRLIGYRGGDRPFERLACSGVERCERREPDDRRGGGLTRGKSHRRHLAVTICSTASTTRAMTNGFVSRGTSAY